MADPISKRVPGAGAPATAMPYTVSSTLIPGPFPLRTPVPSAGLASDWYPSTGLVESQKSPLNVQPRRFPGMRFFYREQCSGSIHSLSEPHHAHILGRSRDRWNWEVYLRYCGIGTDTKLAYPAKPDY